MTSPLLHKSIYYSTSFAQCLLSGSLPAWMNMLLFFFPLTTDCGCRDKQSALKHRGAIPPTCIYSESGTPSQQNFLNHIIFQQVTWLENFHFTLTLLVAFKGFFYSFNICFLFWQWSGYRIQQWPRGSQLHLFFVRLSSSHV